MSTNDDAFSPELLALYYDRLFPYEEMVHWLGYDASVAKDASTPNTLISRREFSFTLENDQYIRYKAFRNADELKSEMKRLMPHYDDTRTCCQAAAICHKCWQLMVAAVKVMDRGLREDFGFQHIMWVYSGRRGIHCWVSDTASRMLTNEARTAVVQYFTLVEGSEHVKRKVKLTEPLHPSLECAHIRAKLNETWTQQLDTTTPWEKWEQLKAAVEHAVHDKKRKSVSDDRRRHLRTCLAEIVFSYLYPRLDANVSKQRNHLLKSRVCVPIDPRHIDDFNYESVPTLVSLERELNATDADNAASKYRLFQEYVDYFAKDFIQPIHMALLKQKKAAAESTAALTGDW
ncbi:hypothetical protein DYB25_004307 [Aphanomyces astaci]|uniref:DNA primase n=1 Tax=Aphanomyces astaci TaxID=112090 RepID=A0A397AWE5_APHAT|nr:hypothetical protein DYB25_004307 [Aphanomyces astaci]